MRRDILAKKNFDQVLVALLSTVMVSQRCDHVRKGDLRRFQLFRDNIFCNSGQIRRQGPPMFHILKAYTRGWVSGLFPGLPIYFYSSLQG